jgi:hypothetical protein
MVAGFNSCVVAECTKTIRAHRDGICSGRESYGEGSSAVRRGIAIQLVAVDVHQGAGMRAPEGSFTVPVRMAGASEVWAHEGCATENHEPETKNKLNQQRPGGIYRPYRKLATRGTSLHGRAAPVRVLQQTQERYTKVVTVVKRYTRP